MSFRTGLARQPPSEAEVCGGGATIHPHKNAAYTCRDRLQEDDLVHMSNVSNAFTQSVFLRKFFLKPAFVLYADLDR